MSVGAILMASGTGDAPVQRGHPEPQFEIHDARHRSGNRYVYCLAPVVPQPDFDGNFETSLPPAVLVSNVASLSVPGITRLRGGWPAAVSSGSWGSAKPMPTARWGLGVGAVNGVLYAIGGANGSGPLRTVEAYDPKTDTWTTKSPMSFARVGLTVAVVKDRIYVVGGTSMFAGTVPVEVYDPRTDTWTFKGPDQLDGHFGHFFSSGAVLKDLLYVGIGEPYLHIYNPASDKWSVSSSSGRPQSGFGAAAANGVIYIVGGFPASNPSGRYWDLLAYDADQNTWGCETYMPTPRTYLAAAVLDGILYAVGGATGSTWVDPTGPNEAYNPDNDSWSIKAPMPTGRQALAAAPLGGKLYAIGGYDRRRLPPTPLSTVEVYTP
jgi:N-acetylneuraminic acid mutarotase